jgi:hypothetical protein
MQVATYMSATCGVQVQGSRVVTVSRDLLKAPPHDCAIARLQLIE